MSNVVFIAEADKSAIGWGVIGGDGKLWGAWFTAMRQIMLNVLPSPMSSARSPPQKLGGGSS
jgi:hypothetical protein